MGFFDWIPTIDEVMDFWDCRVMGHEWRDGFCKKCGKKA